MGVESLVIPGGQEAFRIRARRVTTGLLLDVKIHPIFEQLIDSWCDLSDVRPLHHWGDSWTPANGSSIKVKELLASSLIYNLSPVGEPLLPDINLRNQPAANLSFLRFVGISKGISFVVKGVFSLDEVKRILTSIKSAVEQLYQRELAGFDIELVVSTREK